MSSANLRLSFNASIPYRSITPVFTYYLLLSSPIFSYLLSTSTTSLLSPPSPIFFLPFYLRPVTFLLPLFSLSFSSLYAPSSSPLLHTLLSTFSTPSSLLAPSSFHSSSPSVSSAPSLPYLPPSPTPTHASSHLPSPSPCPSFPSSSPFFPSFLSSLSSVLHYPLFLSTFFPFSFSFISLSLLHQFFLFPSHARQLQLADHSQPINATIY